MTKKERARGRRGRLARNRETLHGIQSLFSVPLPRGKGLETAEVTKI